MFYGHVYEFQMTDQFKRPDPLPSKKSGPTICVIFYPKLVVHVIRFYEVIFFREQELFRSVKNKINEYFFFLELSV